MAPAWMLLIERIKNTDVIMAGAWMLLIERIKNTDVIMAGAWMLLIERIKNTDVIMAPALMLLIERIPPRPSPLLPLSLPPLFPPKSRNIFFFGFKTVRTIVWSVCSRILLGIRSVADVSYFRTGCGVQSRVQLRGSARAPGPMHGARARRVSGGSLYDSG